MSLSVANFTDRLARSIRADLASPGASNIGLDTGTVTAWLNEEWPKALQFLLDGGKKDTIHELFKPAYTININASTLATLPSDYFKWENISVNTVNTKHNAKQCLVFDNAVDFKRFNSSNWLTSPQDNRPVARIADGTIYVYPASTYASKYLFLDYYANHPTFSGSQDSEFGALGDKVLLELLKARYFAWKGDDQNDPVMANLQTKALAEAERLAHGTANIRPGQGTNQTRA